MSGTCAKCGAEFDNSPIAYQGTTFVPEICKPCLANGWRMTSPEKGHRLYQKKDAARELFTQKPASKSMYDECRLSIDICITELNKIRKALGGGQ